MRSLTCPLGRSEELPPPLAVCPCRRRGSRRWFKNTAMILFLNKKDLFNDKIRKVDIRSDGSDGSAPRFLDYTGA